MLVVLTAGITVKSAQVHLDLVRGRAIEQRECWHCKSLQLHSQLATTLNLRKSLVADASRSPEVFPQDCDSSTAGGRGCTQKSF